MSYDLEYGAWRERPLAFLRSNSPDYSDALYLEKRWPKVFDAHFDDFASGDYHGSFRTLSNYKVWTEEFTDTESKTWWDLGQSHGILVRLDIQPSEQKAALRKVERSGFLDQDHFQTLEWETQKEQWNDYGRGDFKREIRSKAVEEDDAAIDALLDVIPDKVFDEAWWSAVSKSNRRRMGWRSNYELSSEILSWIFHTDEIFMDGWDGSLAELLEFLELETSKVIVRLTDTAFGPWQPGPRPGEKTRTLAISRNQLEQSVGAMKLSPRELNKLIHNEDIQVPINEHSLCETLYLECEYPWETEEQEEEQTA